MADTREHQIIQGSNGNGKVREIVLWVLQIAIPILITAVAALYIGQSALGERVKGCEVSAVAHERGLDEIKSDIRDLTAKLDRWMERQQK